MVRLVQVLPRGAAAAVQHRRRALHVRLHRRRGHRRHPVLDHVRAASSLPRQAARPQRLRLVRPGVGDGKGAAGRFLQEDHRLRARGQHLCLLPRRDLSQDPERQSRVRPHRAEPHLQPRGVLPLPRRLRARSAIQRRYVDARNQPRRQSVVDRQADLPLRPHPHHEKAPAGARAALRLDLHPRPAEVARLGPRPRRRDESDEVLPDHLSSASTRRARGRA